MLARSQSRRLLVTIAIGGLLNPWAHVRGESPARKPEAASVPDVRLDVQHRFHGVIVNGQGKPVAQAPIRIEYNASRPGARDSNAEVLATETDEQGRFVFHNLSAGSYRIETTTGVFLCRLWTHAAAPPAAAPALMVVNDSRIARGQRPIDELFRSDALLMATVVAAAIAIPIIVHKGQDDAPEGS